MEKIIKRSYCKKEFIFPSGKTEFVQGYEHFALNELLKLENVKENEIIIGTKNVPKIWYKDHNDMLHRHYVDIFIPSKNLCIEVKSIWTCKKSNVFIKQDAGKELGYNYEIWVYHANGNKIECYK